MCSSINILERLKKGLWQNGCYQKDKIEIYKVVIERKTNSLHLFMIVN